MPKMRRVAWWNYFDDHDILFAEFKCDGRARSNPAQARQGLKHGPGKHQLDVEQVPHGTVWKVDKPKYFR